MVAKEEETQQKLSCVPVQRHPVEDWLDMLTEGTACHNHRYWGEEEEVQVDIGEAAVVGMKEQEQTADIAVAREVEEQKIGARLDIESQGLHRTLGVCEVQVVDGHTEEDMVVVRILPSFDVGGWSRQL